VHGKKIFIATLAGGLLLTLFEIAFGMVANAVAPYDIFAIGGMRTPDDPLMVLFLAYPFVLASSRPWSLIPSKRCWTAHRCGKGSASE
jgi:hypothetical protein